MALEQWHDYLVAQAGASAAIAGLFFVALSINIDRILKLPWLPPRAAMTLMLLVGSVLEALLMLWPSQDTRLAGAELLPLAFAVWFYVTRFSRAATDVPPELSHYTWRNVAMVQFSSLPAVIGSALLLAGIDGGIRAIAASMLASIAIAFLYAWVLLVEILR